MRECDNDAGALMELERDHETSAVTQDCTFGTAHAMDFEKAREVVLVAHNARVVVVSCSVDGIRGNIC